MNVTEEFKQFEMMSQEDCLDALGSSVQQVQSEATLVVAANRRDGKGHPGGTRARSF